MILITFVAFGIAQWIIRALLLTGVSLVAAVIGAATVARIQGLVVDGITPYNLALLCPEVVLLTLSLVAIVFERRRRQQGSGPHRSGVLQPALSR